MPDIKTYTAEHIFTGDEWLTQHSVITEDGIIKEIVPAVTAASYNTLLPAFADLQIYGAYEKLFSVFPQASTLSLIHSYCKKGGAFWFQPTVATNTTDILFACIDAVRSYRNTGGEGCIGLHIEGPWINTEKRGAHIETLVHSPSTAEVTELMEYGQGVISMITLAPEVCSPEIIRIIQQYNVVIAMGHSNITYTAANAFFEKGVHVVTHLYNAMSGLMHREPGLVGAAMLNENVMASIIADGHHVDYAAVTIARKIMQHRLFLITDAVTQTNEGAYRHQLQGDKYTAAGILSGSALTMMQAVKNMIRHTGTAKTEAIKMACTYPAKAIRQENHIAKITKGYPAQMIETDEALSFVKLV